MKSTHSTSTCPCRAQTNTPLSYAQCCQPWHAGWATGVHARTPEQLMRARYSAYALAIGSNPQGHAMLAYLNATWHVSTAPSDLELPPTQWLGLEVLHAEQTAQAGVVEFIARCKVGGKAHRLHEVSRFCASTAPLDCGSSAVRWWYIDGHTSEDTPSAAP